MKEEINYYYNIYPEVIYNDRDGYYFNIGNIKYNLIRPTKTNREIDFVFTIYNEYKKRNFIIDEIILNINSSYISNINSDNYILIKRNEEDKHKNILFINEFDKLIKTNKKEELGYITYDILWSKKVDYYESIVNEIKNDKLKEYFDYFIGLSENAISYVKNTYLEEKDEYLTVAHKIISKDISNILNPFNLIIDYEIRDIAQYTKVMFFNNKVIHKDLEIILSKNNYSGFLLRLLYARLLYTDYYFELIDSDLKENVSEEKVNNIIDKIDDYKAFLIEIHELISEYRKIPKIDWLYRK